MKRCNYFMMLIFTVLLCFVGIVQANDNGITCGNFGVTELKYDDQSDWDQIVKDVFGSEYRVADWNDLKEFYNDGGDLIELYDGLGLTEYGTSVFVTKNSDKSYSSSRYYFASRHEHNKPGSYLAHDNIDNYLISLGSWYTTKQILAIKTTGLNVDSGIIYGSFGVTELRYEDQSDWDQIVLNLFGSEYRVADWNDLETFYNNGGDLLNLYDGLGMTEYGNSAYVTLNGDRSYSSSRYYFASRHEHNKPGSYLAHDNIDNYLMSLGSWYGSNNIMVVKKSDDPTCKSIPLTPQTLYSDGSFNSPASFSATDQKIYVKFEAFCNPVHIFLAVQTQSGDLIFFDSEGNPTHNFDPYKIDHVGSLESFISINHSDFLGNCVFYWLIGDSYYDDLYDLILSGRYELGVYNFGNITNSINIESIESTFNSITFYGRVTRENQPVGGISIGVQDGIKEMSGADTTTDTNGYFKYTTDPISNVALKNNYPFVFLAEDASTSYTLWKNELAEYSSKAFPLGKNVVWNNLSLERKTNIGIYSQIEAGMTPIDTLTQEESYQAQIDIQQVAKEEIIEKDTSKVLEGFVWAGSSFLCAASIVTAPAHGGTVIALGCAPLVGKIVTTSVHSYTDTLVQSGQLNETTATWINEATDVTVSCVMVHDPMSVASCVANIGDGTLKIRNQYIEKDSDGDEHAVLELSESTEEGIGIGSLIISIAELP